VSRTQHLTDKFCAAAPGPGTTGYLIHYDDEVKGFGLRVTRKLARSFVLDYYTRAGDRKRLTIGTFGDWSTAEARIHARGLRVEVDQGHDPQGERTQLRLAPRVSDLVERWRQEHSPRNKPRSQSENERLVAQWILPELGNQLVAEVRFRDVDALHRKITYQHGTPGRANRVIALLSRLFTLAMRWEWCERNPARGIERNAETPRARYVKPEGELERLKAALASHPDPQAAQIVQLMMLTGARSSEVFTARWEHFDLDRNVWTLSATNTKEKRTKHLPLPPATRSLLVEIARLRPAMEGTEGAPAGQNNGGGVPKAGWVFPWKGVTAAISATNGRSSPERPTSTACGCTI